MLPLQFSKKRTNWCKCWVCVFITQHTEKGFAALRIVPLAILAPLFDHLAILFTGEGFILSAFTAPPPSAFLLACISLFTLTTFTFANLCVLESSLYHKPFALIALCFILDKNSCIFCILNSTGISSFGN